MALMKRNVGVSGRKPQASGVDAAGLIGPALLKAEYLRIRPMLEQFIRRRVGSLELAEDIASDVYLKLDRADDSLTVRAGATSYLYRIAINLISDHMRKDQTRNQLIKEKKQLADELDDGPEPAIMAKSDMAIVVEVLATLPEKAHAMLVYSRIYGFSHAEIADKMGVTISLVEKYLTRAIVHCRERLAEIDREDISDRIMR